MDSDDESIGSSVSYIILSDSEAKDIASPTAVLDYVPAWDTDTEPFEAPTSPDYAPGKTVWARYVLPPSIEATIAEYTAAPSHKRCYLSSSPPPSSPSSSSSSSSSPSPPPAMLPPRKRLKMTSTHPDTPDDAMVGTARLRRRSATRRWGWIYEIQDHMEELPLERFKTMQHEIDGAYTSVEASQEEIETLHAELGQHVRGFQIWSSAWRILRPA
ncbi:hypothetical protein Tco_0860861 [Tanacetum coccineum]|uniref:Uncharacterized protein n=1 Tax=Tanacetum coccineum TaxID=301880 RepID=A0ABQ5BHV5_9ASTR